MILRDYQKECVDKCLFMFTVGEEGIESLVSSELCSLDYFTWLPTVGLCMCGTNTKGLSGYCEGY